MKKEAETNKFLTHDTEHLEIVMGSEVGEEVTFELRSEEPERALLQIAKQSTFQTEGQYVQRPWGSIREK